MSNRRLSIRTPTLCQRQKSLPLHGPHCGAAAVRDDEPNNKGSCSLLTVPLSSTLCCLNEKRNSERGRQLPPVAAAHSIIHRQLANRFVYIHAPTPSREPLSSLSLPHPSSILHSLPPLI